MIAKNALTKYSFSNENGKGLTLLQSAYQQAISLWYDDGQPKLLDTPGKKNTVVT